MQRTCMRPRLPFLRSGLQVERLCLSDPVTARKLPCARPVLLAVSRSGRRRHHRPRRSARPWCPAAPTAAAAALAALAAHPGAARAADGQAFRAPTPVRRPGRHHPRPDGPHLPRPAAWSVATWSSTRTPTARWDGRQPDPDARRCALGTDAAVDAAAAAPAAGARQRPTARHHRRRGRGAPRSSSTPPAPPRGWPGRSSPAAPRPTARPAAWRRTSTPAPARCCAREQQIQTVDGSGQSLYSGTVPLQVTQSGIDVPAQGRRRAAAPTRPT